ncbi:DUF3846 domain-containing protein [Sulfobacillus thermosulfidooxidans]|uniref:DUF3846 domain-containing protein n=1 Tax=Sulfobacillus thermosulfidooxidans TaxID=28034 RepID=UPI00178C3F18|nr:DUF3846 domain-containing protein [Sulfobacillus thermosulfidooxidans]
MVIARPQAAPTVIHIAPTLEALQTAVGGPIELWAIEGHVNLLCHEEGRLEGLPFNRWVTLSDGTVWDIYGPLVVVGGHDTDGHFESLTEAEVAQWLSRLHVD